jgi:hypothetical protein
MKHNGLQRWTRWPRAARLAALVMLVTTLMAGALPAGVGAWQRAALPGGVDPFADVIPAALAPAERAAADLSAYRMDVALDPAAGAIGGQMTVTWRNPASQPLSDVWFRLFPNAAYYGDGNLAVSDVTVDGTPVTPELALADTALRVPLPQPVAPGDSAEIALSFTATVPVDATGSYGIFTRDTRHGSWVLADWYPTLTVWEEGSGWALPPVTSFGDPTYAPSAFYDVQVSAPNDLPVVGTGVVAAEHEGDGIVTRRFVAGPARDFALVADDDNVSRSVQADDTRITLWTAPDLDPAIAARTLEIAADALRYDNDRFGPYPARDIDLVQTDPRGALGIAWSGLLMLDGPALLATSGAHDPEGLAAVVAHEMSHLWWGVLIGGDSNKHGFIQEGLATVSSILFLQETASPEAARSELNTWVLAPSRRLLAAGDAVVDVPTEEGQDETIRSDATYGKGSLGLLAVRQEIGEEAFETALRDIATRYAWGEMTPAQLRQAFERASGQDLTAFWRHWFDEAAMTQDEIDAIAAAFGTQGAG